MTKVITALIVSVVVFIGMVQMIFSVNWGPVRPSPAGLDH